VKYDLPSAGMVEGPSPPEVTPTMPKTIPTLKEVVINALHVAREQGVAHTGNPKTVVPVPTVGVCYIINEEGPLLEKRDLGVVQVILDELANTTPYVQKVPTQAEPGYYIHPNAPPGRSPDGSVRPPFDAPCERAIPAGGDEHDERRKPERTDRRRGRRPR